LPGIPNDLKGCRKLEEAVVCAFEQAFKEGEMLLPASKGQKTNADADPPRDGADIDALCSFVRPCVGAGPGGSAASPCGWGDSGRFGKEAIRRKSRRV
jgi:hypothetical protein